MIDRKWQRKHDYLNSKFLSLGLICSKDFINGAPDLVIPLSSVKPFLGEDLPAPVCSSATGVCPYTKKDDVIAVEDFKNYVCEKYEEATGYNASCYEADISNGIEVEKI